MVNLKFVIKEEHAKTTYDEMLRLENKDDIELMKSMERFIYSKLNEE